MTKYKLFQYNKKSGSLFDLEKQIKDYVKDKRIVSFGMFENHFNGDLCFEFMTDELDNSSQHLTLLGYVPQRGLEVDVNNTLLDNKHEGYSEFVIKTLFLSETSRALVLILSSKAQTVQSDTPAKASPVRSNGRKQTKKR